MRATAICDWCVHGIWLALAGGLFFAALMPAESSGNGAATAEIFVQLIPEHPLPGDTVQVRIGIVPDGSTSLASHVGLPKQLSVDAGQLHALRRTAASRVPTSVSGQNLGGDLSCIRWQLPETAGVARITVAAGGQTTEAVIATQPRGTLRLASSLDWLAPAMNLWQGLGVRY